MSIETSMVSYYAERAKEYERIYEKPERQHDLRHLRSFVERTFRGSHVFELACGTGYWTRILARAAASVLATDINEEVLAIASSKPIAPHKATFQKADAYDLPSFPQKFTAGFAGFWWSHVPKTRLREFVRGFHRVLSSAARVVFVDNRYVESSSTPIARLDQHGNSYQVRTLADGSTYEVLKNFPMASELCATIDGLAMDVDVKFLRYYWILSYRVKPETQNEPGSRTKRAPQEACEEFNRQLKHTSPARSQDSQR